MPEPLPYVIFTKPMKNTSWVKNGERRSVRGEDEKAREDSNGQKVCCCIASAHRHGNPGGLRGLLQCRGRWREHEPHSGGLFDTGGGLRSVGTTVPEDRRRQRGRVQ